MPIGHATFSIENRTINSTIHSNCMFPFIGSCSNNSYSKEYWKYYGFIYLLIDMCDLNVNI